MEKEIIQILLADDDADDQELLIEAFSKTEPRVQVHTVVFGKDVIAYLDTLSESQLPELIILDYNMPDCNGVEVLSQLNKVPRYKQIPAVLWSTSNADFYRESAQQNGARDYFYKPHRFDDVVKLSKKILSHIYA
ncbi:response regulator [Pollutibacter soli]|uniref:response regulator n=1 Tax=Pollutibacter soli TaxID=3034157 RepID=UPI003013D24E